MENKKLSTEDLVKELEKLWYDKIPESDRNVVLAIGKGGAINYLCQIQDKFGEGHSVEYRQDLIDNMMDGLYKIDSLHGLIYEHPAGIHVIPKDDNLYILEEFNSAGYIHNRTEVTEEELNTLKNKQIGI